MIASGTRLGPYVIAAPIGAGGMGEVYKATDTRLDRTVAIKVLPEHVASNPDLKQRFEREAKTLAALSHPHICPIHDVGSQNGVDFLVMEYLEGETLEQRLKKGALPLDQALQIGIQVADALAAAHRAGIVHRDLKPGNIMLTKSGAKLLDFGLAKTGAPAVAGSLSMLPTTPPNLTAQGAILGTFQYMAPEQLEGQDADARTDIFAFGAVLYETVTGKKAFEGKSQASLIHAIMGVDPPPMSSLQPLTPPVLDHVVRRCLAKRGDDRWQSASDVTHPLQWVAEAGAQLVVTGSARSQRGVPLGLAWSMATALIVGGSAVAMMVYLRPAVPEPVVTRLDVMTPPTTEPFSFALSPDGRQLVFVANGEKGSQLWVRPLDQITAQPLAGTEGGSYPFWAPDGRAIGFFSDGKLKRLDLTVGVPQVLADAPQPRGASWSRDGVIVFAPSATGGLMRVTATGGTPLPITRVATGQLSHRWPQFLSEGRRFLYLATQGTAETRGLYVATVDGDEPTRVLAADTSVQFAPPGYLLRVSQDVLVAQSFDERRGTVDAELIPVAQAVAADDGTFHSGFSVSAAGVLAHRAGAAARRQLVWVDRSGKMLGAVASPDEYIPANPELTPGGQSIAVNRTIQGNQDIWLTDVGRSVASRFTFDEANESRPVWSPDGRQVVFTSNRNSWNDLFVKPVSGAAEEQPLLATQQNKAPLDWSRDGRFLLYANQDPKNASDLWALPLIGERKPFPVVQTSFDEIEGQFSPDGRWLAYASNESGHYEIYVRPFSDAGGKWQISTAGGTQPRWRADGKELFYVAPGNRLMGTPLGLTTDARSLVVGASVALFQTRLVASAANVAPGGYFARAQYAVTREGRFLLHIAADEAVTSPITIVQNWTAGLKK
jgi:eukaryotic-like serine/threonine-protein kinase